MKHAFLLMGFLIVFSSCKGFYSKHFVSKERWEKEHIYVENCRDNWTYSDLNDSLSIEVIHFENQWNYDLAHFPSFFIGVTAKNDTIGIIDYDFNGNVEIGEELLFKPGKSRMTPESGKNGHTPCFTYSYKRKLNKINCAVKNIYYAELISKSH